MAHFVYLFLIVLVLAGCAGVPAQKAERLDQAMYRWQDDSLSLIQKYQTNPLRASRVLAALHGALLEVRDLSASESQPCRIRQLNATAAQILEYFFPLETPGRLRALAEIAEQGGPDCKLDRVQSVVQAVRTRAQTDGAFPPRRIRTNPSPFVGEWRPTAPIFMNTPAEPFAGEWRLYFADNPAAYPIKGPLSPNSPAYVAATREVINIKQSLTPAQQTAADEWHLDAGSVTPPGVWNQRLRAMLMTSGEQVDEIRLFAAANKAMYDAMVVCWHYKYTYWTERPITASERLGLGAFTPRLVTPPFPSYPSGHSTVSGAVAKVIAAYVPSLEAEANRLAREAADSRLWGGIHFTFDNDDGLVLGQLVGAAAIRAMPPVPKPSR